MAPRKATSQKEPTIAPDRALRALKQQLGALQKLKNRKCQDAEAEETEWDHFTESIIEGAFGNPNSALSKFHQARWAGEHNMMGVSPQQQQINFELRIREHEAVLHSLINTLQLQLPEEEIKGVYEPGEEYEFYRDLNSLLLAATQDILIVDAYLDEQVFNLYISKVSSSAWVRILSNRIDPNVQTVAKMYAKNRRLQMRSTADAHDRAVFIDQRGWVIGQSIKDAARKKPTYMIELNEPLLTVARDTHNRIWAAATVVL